MQGYGRGSVRFRAKTCPDHHEHFDADQVLIHRQQSLLFESVEAL